MFSRDVKHYRSTPRSLNDAFGPYAKLHVPKRRYAALGWMLGYGVAVGAFFYFIVLVRA